MGRLSENGRGILYMCVSMMAFTLNDAAMKAVTQSLPLYETIFLRGALSTLGLIALALVTTGHLRILPARADRAPVALRTLGELGSTALFLTALTQMPLANLSAILQSLPLAVTLTAALVFGDHVGWRRMSAIALGFVGVLIIIRPGADSFDAWAIVGLGAVGFVVLRDLATRRFSREMPSVVPAVWASVAVTVMGALGMAIEGAAWPTLAEWTGIVIAAVFLIGGYLMAIKTMRVGDLSLTAPFRYTSLLWAILLGWVLFGALPDRMTTLGALIVVGSGVYMLLRERHLRIDAEKTRRRVAEMARAD